MRPLCPATPIPPHVSGAMVFLFLSLPPLLPRNKSNNPLLQLVGAASPLPRLDSLLWLRRMVTLLLLRVVARLRVESRDLIRYGVLGPIRATVDPCVHRLCPCCVHTLYRHLNSDSAWTVQSSR